MSQHDSTTEQYGFGDLNGPWVTGIDLSLWHGSTLLGQRPLDRPQLGLGGTGSDWVVQADLARNLWKIVYRSGRAYFVGSDQGSPAYKNDAQSSTLYTELAHQDQLRLGPYRLQISTQAASPAFLVGFTSPHLSTRWALPAGTITLGRVGAVVCLEDATVSRLHASIRCEAGRVWLKAHSQRSETRLNGQLLEAESELELRDGDLLNLGRQVLRFHLPSLKEERDAGLRLACLGPLRVWLAGQALKNEVWQGIQVQHTLIFLCLQRRHSCPEERLIDQLWPGEEVSKKRLANIVSHLRALLKPLHGEPIVREDGGLRLNPGLSIWLDCEEVRELLNRPPTLAHAQKISELYQGPFLASCSSPWAEVLRSQIEADVVAYLIGLAGQQQGETALKLAQQAIALDPLAQSAYLIAIQQLRLAGRTRESKRYTELARTQLERARVPVLPEMEAIFRQLS
ncbi:MAG: FHA domain-containing protein [Vulcanimicrobiota bacterium]